MRQRIRNDGYQDEIKMDTQWLICQISVTNGEENVSKSGQNASQIRERLIKN